MRAHGRSTWLLGTFLACACSQAEVSLPSEAEDPKVSALRIAQIEVDQGAGFSEKDGWTSESRVTEAYPIHGAGRDGVSYYEVKVVTAGQSTGYVLVNVDETDLPVPESATEGKTLTEWYRDQLGRDDLRVVRYDWFSSAAFGASGQLLLSRGFEGASDPTAAMASLEASAREKGVFPAYSRDALAAYYDSLKAPAPTPASGDVEETSQAIETREVNAELKHTFHFTGWHTSQWYQYRDANDYPVGCGPTAWAIVYAYWTQFQGLSRLFGGEDLDGVNAERYGMPLGQPVMKACASAMGTKPMISGGKKVGFTPPWDMCKAVQVAADVGYAKSCDRIYGKSEYTKFDKVSESLKADRPVIIQIGADDKDVVGNHYVVIEAAKKTQQKYAWRWHDRNVLYLVNWGDAATRKWITVHDWALDNGAEHASFSIFLSNFTLPLSHGGKFYKNHEYKYFNMPMTWKEADYVCTRQAGHLISLNNAEENEFARTMLPSDVVRIWTGLTLEFEYWGWRPDGRKVYYYQNWIPGEPSATPGELYVEMRANGQWNNLPNSWKMPFICEWE